MNVAIACLRNMVEEPAALAFEDVEVAPHLPVYFPPRNPVSLSDKGYKFLEVPRSIDNMFGSNLTVIVNISFAF